MGKLERLGLGAAAVALVSWTTLSHAQSAAAPVPSAQAPTRAAAAPSAAASSAAGGEALPPSHPKTGGGPPGMFEPPEDEALPNPGLPATTIAVRLLDADNQPVPHTPVTLGILYNSVAKGESHKQIQRETDGEGRILFDGLEVGSGIAYRVSSTYQGGAYAVAPFTLSPERGGMRVGLHVYPVTNDIEQALVVGEAILYAELKDDRLQIQQAYRFFNFGRVAWVPKDMVLELPAGFTALTRPSRACPTWASRPWRKRGIACGAPSARAARRSSSAGRCRTAARTRSTSTWPCRRTSPGVASWRRRPRPCGSWWRASRPPRPSRISRASASSSRTGSFSAPTPR